MTAAEKAKELIEKFKEYSYTGFNYGEDEMTNEMSSKECALIAVEEIISVLENISLMESGTTKIDYGQNYWQKVKTEIEKIK